MKDSNLNTSKSTSDQPYVSRFIFMNECPWLQGMIPITWQSLSFPKMHLQSERICSSSTSSICHRRTLTDLDYQFATVLNIFFASRC
jgi:hypothetical protein